MHLNVLLLPVWGFLLLVIRGAPSVILAQLQVLAPLNSWPVVGYRKGGATPIWSPVWSSDWDALHVGLHVGCVCTGAVWAAKERVTTAYTRVPSKSKLLANELPNKETTLQIKRHSDNIKTHVFHNSDVRNFTLTQNAPWPSCRGMGKQTDDAKAVCLKNA